jgi:hypothetical protein
MYLKHVMFIHLEQATLLFNSKTYHQGTPFPKTFIVFPIQLDLQNILKNEKAYGFY